MDTENTTDDKSVQDIVPIISGKVNIAEYLEKQVENQPCKRAVIVPAGRRNNRNLYTHVTYAQLLDLCDRYAWGMESAGIKFGDRVIVGIRPGIDLVAVTFALFKLGAVPVFIDPGMGKSGLLSCIKQVEAKAVVAEFKAHLLSWLNNSAFKSVEIFINTGFFIFFRNIF